MNAQDKSSKSSSSMGLGLRYRLGINSASVNTGVNPSTSSTSLINAALLGEFGLGNLFAIQPEIAYSKRGFDQIVSGSGTAKSTFSYLGLNLLPKLRFGNKSLEGFLTVGLGINFKLSATTAYLGTTTDIKNVSGFDFSGIFGLGGSYKLSSGKIFIDGRYNIPFIKANSDGGTHEVKLNQIALNIGYIHNL